MKVSAADVDNGRRPPPPAPGSGPGHYSTSNSGGGGYHLYDHQIGSHGHHHGLTDRSYSHRSSGVLNGSSNSREPRINIRKDYIIGHGINTSSNLNNSSSTNRRTSTGQGLLCGPNYNSCITGRHHSTPVSSSTVVNSSHPPPTIPPQQTPSALPPLPPPPTGSSILPHHLHHHHHHHHNKNQPPPLTASQNLPPPPPSNSINGNTAHCNSDTGIGSNFDSRYYGVMTTGAIDSSLPRTRSSSYRKVPDRSSGQSSLLCRCGSGGALLPPSPPPCIPPVISGFARGAQSLPSTPNANRRLISLSPRLDRTFRLDAERRKQDHSIPGSAIQVPIPPPPPSAPVMGIESCYQGYNASNTNLDCSGIGVSESTVLASGMGIDDQDPNSSHPQHPHHHSGNSRVRAFNQAWSQQRRALRYRTSSRPFAKLSSLIFGLVAVVVIGFIVLSPLFHILLPGQ